MTKLPLIAALLAATLATPAFAASETPRPAPVRTVRACAGAACALLTPPRCPTARTADARICEMSGHAMEALGRRQLNDLIASLQ